MGSAGSTAPVAGQLRLSKDQWQMARKHTIPTPKRYAIKLYTRTGPNMYVHVSWHIQGEHHHGKTPKAARSEMEYM